MDWPISWQKVKDSGAVVFDIADYGLSMGNVTTTENVSIMSDVEQALSDGKTVYIKGDASGIGFPAHVVCPIMMYSFFDQANGKLGRFCAAGLVRGSNGNRNLLAIEFTSSWNVDTMIGVEMTMHQFLGTLIG